MPRKRFPKGPPFGFLLFKRYLQTWTGLKGPPFRFFFGTVRLFSKFFLSPKGPPFRFLLFKRKLKNRPRLKGPPFDFFRHCATFFERKKFQKFQKFPKKMFCAF